MKNIISRFSLLLIVLLLNMASALAQKMTVESFGIAPNGDISASAYSRLDLNGNKCALVKVGLALQGAKFEGGIMGDVVYKTGEYWVYMPKGNRVLQIKHDNYLPLMVEFGQYGIEKLEGNTTYKLTIVLPQTATAATQEQTLTINFKPTNAIVLVDGRPIKSSNGKAVVKLPVKSHEYIVTAEGYDPEEGMVKLKDASPTTLNVELVKTASASQTVQVTTTNISQQTAANDVGSTPATTGTHRGHEWVDLGLPSGTKWATTNVGASSPSDYGNYYAWGETTTKSSYDWSNLKYCLGRYGHKFSKYVTDSQYGKVDGKKELDKSDDAAYVNWGKGWRVPSLEQIKELKEKCTWTWTSMGDHNGYKVVGPNGKSLFLPAAGYRDGSSSINVGSYGTYWSRSLCTSYGGDAYRLYFNSDYVDWLYLSRYYGRSVRAVLAP